MASGFGDTPYDGAVEWVTARAGGQQIRLLRPTEPDRLLGQADVLQRNRADDYMPYWAYLWPGAFLLAEAVAAWDSLAGARLIELGCGLGLAGLAALRQGAHVRFTDYDAASLRFVAQSAHANTDKPDAFSTGLLDWRDLPDDRFDVVLGADLLYETRLVPLVTRAIAQLLAPNGVALVAGPFRVATDDLPIALERNALEAESRPIAAFDLEGNRVTGTLHIIRRPPASTRSPRGWTSGQRP